jgi:hypothetical protein
VTFGGLAELQSLTAFPPRAERKLRMMQEAAQARRAARFWQDQQHTEQTISTARVWHDWNLQYVYTTTATAANDSVWFSTVQDAAAYDITWQAWSSDAESTGTTITSNVWGTWNCAYITYNGDRPPVGIAPPLVPFSPEQLAEQQRQTEARRVAAEAKAKRDAEAREKAKALLREFLDDHQRDTLDKHRWFEVVSPAGRTYRIHQGRQGNVFLIEGGHQVMRYCIHPAEWVPDEDTMLAQALMLRCSEDDFVTIANKTPLRAAA